MFKLRFRPQTNEKSGQDRSRANLSVGSEQLIEATFDTSISEDADNSNLLFSLKDASTAGHRVLLGVLLDMQSG